MAVLGVELRFVEETHLRIGAVCSLVRWPVLGETAHLVGLVVVDGEAAALAMADATDILPRDQHAPVGTFELAIISNSVVWPRWGRAPDAAVNVETGGRGAVKNEAPVHLAHALQGQQRAIDQYRPPNICRLKSGSCFVGGGKDALL
jgi:hypothetical protein